MSAHSYSEAFKLPARSNSLGPASNVRCDHCREELGLGIHFYWHMQFCSSACMTAYQQRLAPETTVKICRLDDEIRQAAGMQYGSGLPSKTCENGCGSIGGLGDDPP
jgi:hypothetical protein